jgi:hypothetical protein
MVAWRCGGLRRPNLRLRLLSQVQNHLQIKPNPAILPNDGYAQAFIRIYIYRITTD